jgi:hypothetical protein
VKSWIPDASYFELPNMEQSIRSFHKDEQGHWVAELACGHTYHVRHDPPWLSRPWVLTESGRAGFIGHKLNCRKCDLADSRDDLLGGNQ